MNSWLLLRKDGHGKRSVLSIQHASANNISSIVIQYEDWKNPFASLERYQHTYTMFNDDVQGTGAVIVGGFINAVKASGVAAKDHRAVFLGAGSAGVGVAKQIVEYFIKEGLTEDEAKRKFWLVDSKVCLPKNHDSSSTNASLREWLRMTVAISLLSTKSTSPETTITENKSRPFQKSLIMSNQLSLWVYPLSVVHLLQKSC